MNAWDIYTFDFPEIGPHPAVIISHPSRAANKPWVDVLLGSTQRVTRPAVDGEVVLNGADGLDWETLVRCDLIYAVPKKLLHGRRGAVSRERRRQIVREIIRSHGWNLD